MKIITTNELLMALVPNVVTTVEGEQTLFEKISPELQAAEDWVACTFTGDDILDDIAADTTGTLWQRVAGIIVEDALHRAIPSLDLVLTPNGFGIVSNQNLAPASKDRVERLITKLVAQRDSYINLLIDDLRTLAEWQDTEQYQWFAASLISWPKACVNTVVDRPREGQQWDQFLQLRERAILIEDAIAEKWISPDVMTQLRTELLIVNNATVHQVALKVRSCVFNELRGMPRNHWDLDRIVNFIRNNGDIFPDWATSETARLYNAPTVFRNKKESTGYFF